MNDGKTNPTNHDKCVAKLLEDPGISAAFLNELIANYREDDKVSQRIFLSGLKKIVRAQIGFTELAKATGLGRESLYKTLSENGNPQLGTLLKILRALNFEIHIKETTADQVESPEVTECDSIGVLSSA